MRKRKITTRGLRDWLEVNIESCRQAGMCIIQLGISPFVGTSDVKNMSSETRRSVLKRGGAGIAGLLTIGGGLHLATESALAASGLTANDVNVSTTDGELNQLTINPEVTVSWSGRESDVSTVEVTWFVKTASTSETTVGNTPYSFSVASPSQDGSITKTIDPINLLSNNGGALSGSNFDAASDGTSNTTDVMLSMDATIKDSGSNILESKTDILGPKTFSVTVTNETSSMSASGTANTGGS